MARQPGERLRGLRDEFERSLGRVARSAEIALPGTTGIVCVVLSFPILLPGLSDEVRWSVPALGTILVCWALVAWWRSRGATTAAAGRGSARIVEDLGTGADSEETIGKAIEWALTRSHCVVAHNVADIPGTKSDIDHLVVSPAGIWVVETKTRWIKSGFPEVLGRIAANVDAVSRWPPARDVPVCGVLAFADLEPERRGSVDDHYHWHGKRILAFRDREELAAQLRSGESSWPQRLRCEVWNRR
ncbi:MAG: nuclease-related domain-containing protein [Gammaproteobacteria bacterium]|nr:nuclease-related domain-containing protein [Gammaproteobacteria bacterium]